MSKRTPCPKCGDERWIDGRLPSGVEARWTCDCPRGLLEKRISELHKEILFDEDAERGVWQG